MLKKDEVKDIVVAINSVKSRAKKALLHNNMGKYELLMGDLIALEVCLVYSVEGLIEELDKNEAA